MNRAFAGRYLDESPLGEMVRLGDKPGWQVVGVVEDVRRGLDATQTEPEVFFSYRQQHTEGLLYNLRLVVRTRQNPSVLHAGIRRAVREVDPPLPSTRS